MRCCCGCCRCCRGCRCCPCCRCCCALWFVTVVTVVTAVAFVTIVAVVVLASLPSGAPTGPKGLNWLWSWLVVVLVVVVVAGRGGRGRSGPWTHGSATKKTPSWLSKHVRAHSKVSESVQLKITNELTDPTRCEQSRPVKTNMKTPQQHDNLTMATGHHV